jgi:hypothetical protein
MSGNNRTAQNQNIGAKAASNATEELCDGDGMDCQDYGTLRSIRTVCAV